MYESNLEFGLLGRDLQCIKSPSGVKRRVGVKSAKVARVTFARHNGKIVNRFNSSAGKAAAGAGFRLVGRAHFSHSFRRRLADVSCYIKGVTWTE